MKEPEVPPPLEPVKRPKWFSDIRAKKEEENWPNEDKLKQQKNANDLLWLKCYGWIVVLVTIFFTAMFLISLGFWAWHFIMPVSYGWLTPDQLSKIQSIIFSGSLGAIVSSTLQKHLSK